jgi:O-antigen ligase
MISVSLCAAVILAALLFGAVYPWSMAIVALVVVIVFIYFLWSTKDLPDTFSNGKGIILAALLFFSYPLFQLIPLPVSMLSLIHPKFKELVTVIPGAPPAFHSVSIYPFATEMEVCRLFIYLAVFTVAAFGLKDNEDVRRILKALVVFGFILGVFAIIQKATWNGKIYWFKEPIHPYAFSFGSFVNKNHFAGFMGMIIPFSLGIALRSRRLEEKVMFAFFGVVMAISLFFSLSRGGIISFIASMFVFSLIILTKGMTKKKFFPIALFSLALTVYLLFLGVSPIVERFAKGEVSGEQRLKAWHGTLQAFRDFPVFGSGMGTFQDIFKVYQPDGLYLYWTHAHNDYLELLLELGIVGAALAAVFFFTALRAILKTKWKGREVYIWAAVLASLTAIAVHSIVDFNLHIPSNAILFSLVLGIGVFVSRRSLSDS